MNPVKLTGDWSLPPHWRLSGLSLAQLAGPPVPDRCEGAQPEYFAPSA